MSRPGDDDVAGAAELLKTHGDKAVLLLGGSAAAAPGMRAAAGFRPRPAPGRLWRHFPPGWPGAGACQTSHVWAT